MIKHGKLFEIVNSTREGSRVRVKAQVSENRTVTAENGHKHREMVTIAMVEAVGGFKYRKDFNYEIAERLALDNCADRFQTIV